MGIQKTSRLDLRHSRQSKPTVRNDKKKTSIEVGTVVQ